MAKQWIELPIHNGAGIPIREPLPNMLGFCPCGCKEAVTSNYAYLEWNDEYFVDRSHVIAYLKNTDGLLEVG